ncbi:Crp/Fnr family transcriptional regulator [Sulfurimonas sp. HSL-1656]|uniref:Crp/Fnr family transcriptional regulator n=1 Tax=Thiomicrolovo subterrani TaxID=3131934 RepID=UPI0031F7EBFE
MGLEHCYLFNRLEADDLALLREITQVKSYSEGSTLFYAGERPGKLRLIASGVVQVVKHDTAGNEIVLAHFRADDLVAEAAHFENIPYPATARCVTDVTLYEIDFEAFKSRFLNRPEVALGIIRSLTYKIRQLEAVIRRTSVDDAQTRLARFLLEHADALPVTTQKQIASQIGLTPETVSRIVRRFKARGWVEVRARKIVIIDPEGLRSLQDETE